MFISHTHLSTLSQVVETLQTPQRDVISCSNLLSTRGLQEAWINCHLSTPSCLQFCLFLSIYVYKCVYFTIAVLLISCSLMSLSFFSLSLAVFVYCFQLPFTSSFFLSVCLSLLIHFLSFSLHSSKLSLSLYPLNPPPLILSLYLSLDFPLSPCLSLFLYCPSLFLSLSRSLAIVTRESPALIPADNETNFLREPAAIPFVTMSLGKLEVLVPETENRC